MHAHARCACGSPQAEGESSSILPASSKPYPSASGMSFLPPVSFQSVPFLPPPGLPGQRDLNSRVSCARLCRRGRVLAPARFARLIARAPGRHGTHFTCRLNRGRSAPGRHGRRSSLANAAPILKSQSTTAFTIVNHHSRISSNNMNKTVPQGSPARACRKRRRFSVSCGREPSAGAGGAGNRR